jgi:hypothetical protein
MRGRVWIMLAVGLLGMLIFWYFTWESEQAKLAADAPITHCADSVPADKRVECPASHPVCWTHERVPNGVCASRCTFVSSCPKNWCCQPQADDSRLCTPAAGCAAGAPRAQ